MEDDFELEYDVQEVRLSDELVYKVTTVANEALPLEMLLQLESRREEISGQRLWEGSLLLCAHLLEACQGVNGGNEQGQTLDLKGKAVLELGAGTGVVSMLTHSLGASPVAVTDGDERCVLMAARNTGENGIPAAEAFVSILRWGNACSTAAFCKAYEAWRSAESPLLDASSPDAKSERELPTESRAVPNRNDIGNEQTQPIGTPVDQEDGARIAQPVVVERDDVSPMKIQPTLSAVDGNTSSPLRSFDFVFAGDVLYKRSLLPPFLETVDDMLAPGGRLLLCHVPRAGVTYDVAEEAFGRAGFAFQVLSGGKGKENVNGGRGDVGGVDLCMEDARRARLYSVTRKCEGIREHATMDCTRFIS